MWLIVPYIITMIIVKLVDGFLKTTSFWDDDPPWRAPPGTGEAKSPERLEESRWCHHHTRWAGSWERGGWYILHIIQGWPQPNIEPLFRHIKPIYIWTYYINNYEKLLVASLMLIYCVSIIYIIHTYIHTYIYIYI